MFRLTTLLNFLMILTAADAALAQTPGVPLASAPRLSGAMGLEPRVAFDNGHPVVAYTDWATQTIWAWDPSSTPVNLNFQAAACDGGHGGLLCLIQSPQPFPLPPIPALKVVEFGAPDQQINTNATGVALDKYAAWRNVATGTIETMEFPFPATVTDSGLQGERPSVFAEFVAYQHNAAAGWQVGVLAAGRGAIGTFSVTHEPRPTIYGQRVWYQGGPGVEPQFRWTYGLHDIQPSPNFGGLCSSYVNPKAAGIGAVDYVIFQGLNCGADGDSVLYLYAPLTGNIYKIDNLPPPAPTGPEYIWYDVTSEWVTYTDNLGQVILVEIDIGSL